MLNKSDPIATLPVKDMVAGRKFYENVLGFEVSHVEGDGGVEYKSGNTKLFVYQSQYAGNNQATAVTWMVDVEKVVKDLKGKGVKFEHYDMPGVTRDGDIHTAGNMKLAWFKDPDGNIHALAGQ